MKFSDFFCDFLSALGVKHVFGVTGGSVLHLLSSAEKSSKLEVTYTHHEQSAALAAVNYSRIISAGGACFVTTGPGGTNAVTGLASAWLDSIPAIFVSGQARERDVAALRFVRQVSSQHLDIVSVVRPLTKWAECLTGSWEEIAEHLASLKQCFLTNRPGPVWVDIPLDLQQKTIDQEAAALFASLLKDSAHKNTDADHLSLGKMLSAAMTEAERPLFVVGGGAILSGAAASVIKFAEEREIPYVTTWPAFGVASSYRPLNLGVIGISGTRDANLACYLADLVVSFGSPLGKQITGDNLDDFAPHAQIHIINLDSEEGYRFQDKRFRYHTCDLRHFEVGDTFNAGSASYKWGPSLQRIKDLRDVGIKQVMESTVASPEIDQYEFLGLISSCFRPGDTIVIDGGGNVLFSAFQHLKMAQKNRAINGCSIGCMGSGLPEAIGAAFATGKRTYCFIGDGSFQFNVQELATIGHHELDIVVVLIDNNGYKAIIDSQDAFFDHRFGVNESTGLSMPNWESLVGAYGLPYERLESRLDLLKLKDFLTKVTGPLVLHVVVPSITPLIPRGGFKEDPSGSLVRRAPWDMYPDLPDFSLGEVIGDGELP